MRANMGLLGTEGAESLSDLNDSVEELGTTLRTELASSVSGVADELIILLGIFERMSTTTDGVVAGLRAGFVQGLGQVIPGITAVTSALGEAADEQRRLLEFQRESAAQAAENNAAVEAYYASLTRQAEASRDAAAAEQERTAAVLEGIRAFEGIGIIGDAQDRLIAQANAVGEAFRQAFDIENINPELLTERITMLADGTLSAAEMMKQATGEVSLAFEDMQRRIAATVAAIIVDVFTGQGDITDRLQGLATSLFETAITAQVNRLLPGGAAD